MIKKLNGKKAGKGIFEDIKDKESRYYTAKGLIRNFAFDRYARKKEDTPCTNGLRQAIKGLHDREEIRRRLPTEYQDWLGG